VKFTAGGVSDESPPGGVLDEPPSGGGVSDEPPHAKSMLLTQMISREFRSKPFDFFNFFIRTRKFLL
jgi:hypothetical protein